MAPKKVMKVVKKGKPKGKSLTKGKKSLDKRERKWCTHPEKDKSKQTGQAHLSRQSPEGK